MIKLEINSLKELSIESTSKIFKGENLINSFQVTAANPYIGEKRVTDCEFNLHVVFPNRSFLVYPIAWNENSIPLTGFVPITGDITSAAQFLKLYVEIKSGNTVIGKTNTVKLQVYDSPDEQTSITPREQLEEQIEELEQELESASTLTDTLAELKGTYNSVAERLAADESNIASNTENNQTARAAVVALAASLGGKLDNAPNSVGTSNIAVSSVTSAKLVDGCVTYDKLSSALQDVVDCVPDVPLYAVYLSTLSSANAFNSGDYCTLGGVWQFVISGALATAVGINEGSPCELRFVNGYQIITQTDTQQVFARQVTRVAPTFIAASWTELVNPRVTALEDAAAENQANDNLEAALSGLSATKEQLNNLLENTLNGGI